MMLGIFKLFFLIALQFIFVQCLLPRLSVQRLDRNLIQKKRQDTLEMCRMFNEESQYQQHPMKSLFLRSKNYRSNRLKREAGLNANPALNAADLQRVEHIVDKLYDDVEENGKRVTYRQKDLDGLTTEPAPDKSGRRLNFAPALIIGPGDPLKDSANITDPGTARIPWRKKWKHGIIPYFIDSKTYDSHLAEIIRKAFDYFEKVTCIRLQRLREKPTDKASLQNVEWVYITNPSGIRQCVHSNERKPNKGVQIVVFGYDCMSTGEIVHEVMHVLGYSHEHTRPDRDEHISVLWDNIKPGYKKYFELRTEDHLMSLPYDYASVLHYPQRAFSKNGQVTLKSESGIKLGQREALSEIDAEKVSMIYGFDCVARNKQYLLTTCPSVVKSKNERKHVAQKDIEEYFKDKIWPFAIVNYKLRDKMEFSVEERENINAVIRHIERETCIEFRNVGEEEEDDDDKESLKKDEKDNKNHKVDSDKSSESKGKSNEQGEPRIISKEDADEKNGLRAINSKSTNDVEIDNNIISEDTNANNLDVKLSKAPGIFFVDDLHNVNETSEGNKTVEDNGKPRVKRDINGTKSPSRRHSTNSLIFTRSADPGCKCPKSGRPDGEQTLVINADCFNSVNDLLHLFVHLLGLDHQHNQYDRDSYLHIVWDQLSDDVKNEMREKLPPAASVGFQYDYQSVMHYPWLQINNGVTNIMYPIWNDGWAMGHWQGLSSTDVHKLNLIYLEQCAKRKDTEGKS